MPVAKDKVRVSWPIDIETAEMFKEFVLKKYGTDGYGHYGYELNRIIFAAIKKSGGKIAAHTHINSRKVKLERTLDERQAIGKNKATELRDKVVGYIFEHSEREKEPRIKVGIVELEAAISAVTGVSDGRAIKNKIRLLRSVRFISQHWEDAAPEDKIDEIDYEIITGYHPDLDSKSKEELR
jgi:hypothetical protein